MTDRPIIFSAPMIRALLDGRKTQDRRVLKPQPFPCADGWGCVDRNGAPQKWLPCLPKLHPYAPGDRLWVREAWRVDAEWDDCPPREFDGADAIHYEADSEQRLHLWGNPFTPGRLRSPIHMSRWASRLTLLVTEVRVQRLQDISAEDVTAEGIPFESDALAPYEWSVSRFADIWNSIHGPDAWDANPWVAAISFTVHRCNIDTMEEGTW